MVPAGASAPPAVRPGLSVAICFFLGAIEVLGLLPQEIGGLSQTTGFWGFVYHFNINTAGFIIVGMFILTWLAALLIWRFGRIEERWTARLQPETPDGVDRQPT